MQLIFRVQPEKDSAYARIWLITKDGAALSGVAHGVIFKDRDEQIASMMEQYMEVQRDDGSEPCKDTPAQAEKQGSIFDEM